MPLLSVSLSLFHSLSQHPNPVVLQSWFFSSRHTFYSTICRSLSIDWFNYISYTIYIHAPTYAWKMHKGSGMRAHLHLCEAPNAVWPLANIGIRATFHGMFARSYLKYNWTNGLNRAISCASLVDRSKRYSRDSCTWTMHAHDGRLGPVPGAEIEKCRIQWHRWLKKKGGKKTHAQRRIRAHKDTYACDRDLRGCITWINTHGERRRGRER